MSENKQDIDIVQKKYDDFRETIMKSSGTGWVKNKVMEIMDQLAHWYLFGYSHGWDYKDEYKKATGEAIEAYINRMDEIHGEGTGKGINNLNWELSKDQIIDMHRIVVEQTIRHPVI